MDSRQPTYWDYIRQYQSAAPDPYAAWQQAVVDRAVNRDPQLANAEHYLWNQNYVQRGPVEALGGLLNPFGYYAAKKMGLLSGTPATIEQLQAGLQGAFSGLGWGKD